MSGQMRGVLGVLLFLLATARGAFPNYTMSDMDLKTAAGYYDGNGKYLGGIPEVDAENLEYGECVTPEYGDNANGTSSGGAADATGCAQWEEFRMTPEVEGAESTGEFRLCTCGERSDREACVSWTCSTVEADPENTDCETSSGVDSRRRRLAACYTQLATDSTRCRCDDEEELRFCTAWSCEQYYEDTVTYETYTCVRASDANLHCAAWTAEMLSDARANTQACECAGLDYGDGICSYWDCTEKGIDACERCNMTISIAAFGICGLVGVWAILRAFLNRQYLSVCVFLAFLWTIVAAGGAILYGGQDGGMWVAIMWAIFIIVYSFCCRPHEE